MAAVVPPAGTTAGDAAALEALQRTWGMPRGIWGWLTTVQNGPIGKRIVGLAFLFLLLGGINALLMRTQLAVPENDFLDPETYNALFTMHGSMMMFLFSVPFLEGAITLILPSMLGARELPFPRLTAFTWWTFLFGGLFFYGSFLLGYAPTDGWFAYTPLSGPQYSPGLGMDVWLLGLSVAEIGGIAAVLELIIAIFKTRAPGMALNQMPIFAWSVLAMALMMLFGFTPLLVGSLLLELDRMLGMQFFNVAGGGDPILWQHLFWIFGHPDVYIQFIPAAGMAAMVAQTFSRRPIIGTNFVVVAIIVTALLSLGLWVHHMFAVGLPEVAMTFFTAASMVIAIPSGIQILALIGTIWFARRVAWRTPLLFVVGFLVIFVIGGLTGPMLAAVPFDWQVHDSFFVVAHFHYVLIGGVVFPMFAGIYYWTPKFFNFMLDERLGQWNFWLMFIGFNVAFFPMHFSGLLGMPRRVYTYAEGSGLGPYNLVSTIGAFILALGILVFVINFFVSWQRGGPAGDNPWDADTLEWAQSSPPPMYGFWTIPIVHSRHPLWDQERLDVGDPRTEAIVRTLARWPSDWRAAIITSTLDGEPEEIYRVAGPSIWPLVTAIGVFGIFGALTYGATPIAIVGAVVTIIGVLAWNWPGRPKARAEEDQDATVAGIPVYAGLHTAGIWAMGLAILTAAVALATLIFSYFFIRLNHPVWPPTGIALPAMLVPGLATVALVLSGAPMAWAMHAIRGGNQGGLKLGLAAGFLLGLAALVAVVIDYREFAFDYTTNAYGSLVYTIGAIFGVMVIAGLGMNALTQLHAWQGGLSARRHLWVTNTVMYWYFIVIAWLFIFTTLYLAPYTL
jgi:cytochrome c oxidase subunit I+III